MHWRACCLTLDRAKCLQYLPNTTSSDQEPILYVHPLVEGDTYDAIIKSIPPNVESSDCFKGIVLINYSQGVLPRFWGPYASNEAPQPLYLVGVEHAKLFLQKAQPKQPQAPYGPVQAQGSKQSEEALNIRFVPASGGELSHDLLQSVITRQSTKSFSVPLYCFQS